MSTPPPSPRLFVIFAKEAHVAAIFARGPTNWFHVIRWDTRNDVFESGAWMRGRLYPQRCDLSPDGELLLYFVFQKRRGYTSYESSWTAVSRLPWLHALGLWPQGHTWGGGGYFITNRIISLENGRSCKAHPEHIPLGLEVISSGGERKSSSNEVAGAEWSGRDQRNRLIFTANGKLHWQRDDQTVQVLADFNGDKPDPRDAPEWAKRSLVD
ncbi:hypothetical protein UNDYM_3346 [Undibacterium sp. YM2]|uniref:hypothetical protein n=1 Tax=Undibacterium sp. YM2 TaxID=2058625 RepID=UPI001331D0C4|nr:hypothetical protein [Undibacterium sp. YM2]BBB67599.1 hypothetical protein UNDYM_3346 [Undibacterium sp. YM2]